MLCATIKKKSDFSYIRNHGSKVKMPSIVVIYANQEQSIPMIGYIAGKNVVGNAVKRNKAKRRFRHLVREYNDFFDFGDLFIFIATKNTISAKFSDLRDDFIYCLTKYKLIKNN